MAGFDPERATRQLFVDAVLGSLLAHRGQEGWGWHLVSVIAAEWQTVLVFETPQPLKGWKLPERPNDPNPSQRDGSYLEGPHQVRVTVAGLPRVGRAD